MAATLVIQSNFSNWISHQGYNYHADSGSFTLGQIYYGDGGDRTYFTHNGYAVFPGGVEGQVVGGRIEVPFGVYTSDQSSEVIAAYDMNSSLSDLLGEHVAGIGLGLQPHLFQDAQSGSLFGEGRLVLDYNGSWGTLLQIDLSPAAVAWMNDPMADSPFAIGFTVRDIAPQDYVLLSILNYQGGGPRLVLDVIPEAGVSAMLCLGVAGLCLVRRRWSCRRVRGRGGRGGIGIAP